MHPPTSDVTVQFLNVGLQIRRVEVEEWNVKERAPLSESAEQFVNDVDPLIVIPAVPSK